MSEGAKVFNLGAERRRRDGREMEGDLIESTIEDDLYFVSEFKTTIKEALTRVEWYLPILSEIELPEAEVEERAAAFKQENLNQLCTFISGAHNEDYVRKYPLYHRALADTLIQRLNAVQSRRPDLFVE